MRKLLSLLPVFVLVMSVAYAQGAAPAAGQTMVKGDVNAVWKCSAPEGQTQLPVPGQANRAYSIFKGKCTAASGTINGVKEKDGMFVEFSDATATTAKGHGVFVETLVNGDTLTINYTTTGTMKDNMMLSGGNTWTIASGTGALKGIKGTGGCKGKGNPDGSGEFTCTGTYTIAK